MSSKVQSVLFKRKLFTPEKALEWLVKNEFNYDKIHVTKQYYRFRQFKPDYSKQHRIKTIVKGIKFIYEF